MSKSKEFFKKTYFGFYDLSSEVVKDISDAISEHGDIASDDGDFTVSIIYTEGGIN